MRVVLVGADFEENLGIGTIAAAARDAGHDTRIVPFNSPNDQESVIEGITSCFPDVVGLSIGFQHRAHEFLSLTAQLRNHGYRGHITLGGQFPTLAWREVLSNQHGVDTIVLHEGELTFPELLDGLGSGTRLAEIPGLALLSDDGVPIRTTPRALTPDLDEHPFALRYREHSRHVDVPFIPIMGSRGCWGSCSYCSITSFYRDARKYCGEGSALRLRSPESIATEMALLWHRAKGPSIFCFHDDNLLLRRPADSLDRLTRIRRHLDDFGVGKVGIVGKCRPETLTHDLAREIAELGVIRLYLGVENVSSRGAAHLRRRKQVRHVEQALAACRSAGIFVCYNLLIFEPWTKTEDVRENIELVRTHPGHPVNFCRAEPYYGTPLHLKLREQQELGGSYLGWNYRIEEDRSELLFRVCAAAFRERNFAPSGVANRSMGIGYALKVAEHFYEPGSDYRFDLLRERADRFTRGLTTETADYLERAVDMVEGAKLPEESERVERETALLAIEIATADRRWQNLMDELYDDIDGWAAETKRPVTIASPTRKLLQLAGGVALGLSITIGATACGGPEAVDPVPPDAGADADMVADPLPPDGGRDADQDHVADPLPPDAGRDADTDMVADPLPPDAGRDADQDFVADPLPPDAGHDADYEFIADPPPEDAGRDADMPMDPPPRDTPRASLDLSPRGANAEAGGWRDTVVRRAIRTNDLPLHDPPEVRLTARREGDLVVARLEGGPAEMTLRWSASSTGTIEGDGREVRWTPVGPRDQLVAAVRSTGGVAVVTLRAKGV